MKQLPLIERATTFGDRVAVCTTTQSHSYKQIVRRSAEIATALLEGREDLDEARVAFLIPAGFDYISTQWGIWRAGGIAVPLSASATDPELEYALTDSQSSLLVADEDTYKKLEPLCNRLNLRLMSIATIERRLQPATLPKVNTDRRAMILYTSGTTSKPKGVVTTHRCIQAQIESLIDAWRWQTDDRIPLFLPLHHIHGIINIMSCALWSGARIDAFARFDLSTIFGRVAENAYTVFMAVPTIYVKLIEALEAMPADQRPPIIAGFGRMRLMISGSAALPASVHKKWTQLTGQELLERYGMTEIGMALSNPYEGERRPGAVGQALPGVEIRLQSDLGELITQQNMPGEIQVRGPGVFCEYWNRAEATQQSHQDGWFRTGDMAVLEGGYFRIMGRSSIDIIKSGGYKLSALEIEAVLLDHPAICECAVMGIPDATWGEAVVAAVVLKLEHRLELDELRAWCKHRISPYKFPRQLLVLEQLPRNAMGKVTKSTVRDLFSANPSSP